MFRISAHRILGRTAMVALIGVILLAGVASGEVTIPKPAGIEIPAKLPQLKGPVAITTIGQAPGASWVNVLLKGLKIPSTMEDMLSPNDLVAASKNPSTAFKTLVLTMGTSGKGMGGAGVDIDAEIARCNALVTQAKKLGIFVVGAQIEGAARRTDQGDERSNKVVSSQSDLLIVRKEVDGDAFFTNAAKQRNIPIIRTVESLDFKYAFAVLFNSGK
ncbi:MAG: DUF6305 family protein [Clostridia bacterium]|nr:DUF6305 family protein [Clostridia bacterium]